MSTICQPYINNIHELLIYMNYFSRSSRPFPNKKIARCTPGVTPRHDDLGALQTTDLIQDGSHFRDWKMCTWCQMKMMKSRAEHWHKNSIKQYKKIRIAKSHKITVQLSISPAKQMCKASWRERRLRPIKAFFGLGSASIKLESPNMWSNHRLFCLKHVQLVRPLYY